MDSLPYVDALVKEYLLFRGFSATLQSLSAELAADRCCGFQAEALCEVVFGVLLPQCRLGQLLELLELLSDRLYSQLDARFEAGAVRLEVALIKAGLVCCVRQGRQERVADFFRSHGEALMAGPEACVWRQWAALALLPAPRRDPTFAPYFSPEWMSLLEVSFRNFLSQAVGALPLPAILRFNEDRTQRLALQQQVDSLQRQLEALRRQLAGALADVEAARAAAPEPAAAAPAPAAVATMPIAAAVRAPTGAAAATAAAAAGVEAARPTPQQPNGRHAAAPASATASAGPLPHGGAVAAAAPNVGGPLRSGVGAAQPDGVSSVGQRQGQQQLSASHPPPQGDGTAAAQAQPQAQAALAGAAGVRRGGSTGGRSRHGRTLSLEAWTGDDLADGAAGAPPAPAAAAQPPPPQVPSARAGRPPSRLAASSPVPPPQQQQPEDVGGGAGGAVALAALAALEPVSGGAVDTVLGAAGGEEEVPLGRPLANGQGQEEEQQGPGPQGPELGQAFLGFGSRVSVSADADMGGEGSPVVGPLYDNGARGGVGHVSESDGRRRGERIGRPVGPRDAVTDMLESGDPAELLVGGPEEGEEEEQGGEEAGDGGSCTSEGAPEAVAAGPGVAGQEGSQGAMHAGAGGGGALVVGGGRWHGTAAHVALPGSHHAPGSAVLCAHFSPGGHNVATGAADGAAVIWCPPPAVAGPQTNSSREARLACHSPVTSLAWDARADKVMLVGTAGRGIRAWHADTRRVSAELPPDPAAPCVCALACSRQDPVFIVASATAAAVVATAAAATPPAPHGLAAAPLPSSGGGPSSLPGIGGGGGGGGVAAMTAMTAAAAGPPASQRLSVSAAASLSTSPTSGGGGAGLLAAAASGGGGGALSPGGGRLSVWNMRAFKRVASYNVPQEAPVVSLAFNAQGSWFAAGTASGAVHLFESSSSAGGGRPQPLSSFRANALPAGSSLPATPAPAAVQVYDNGSEAVLVTCCSAAVRLWSLRRLAEPLASLPLLPYLPYGGGAGGGWSPAWRPGMALAPNGGAAAVVLGGGGPALYVVDLQASSRAGGAAASSDDSGGGGWGPGMLGAPAAGSHASIGIAAAASRISVIVPYSGDGGVAGGGGGVYGVSCSWHPGRDVVVVGYSDGAVQTLGLARAPTDAA